MQREKYHGSRFFVVRDCWRDSPRGPIGCHRVLRGPALPGDPSSDSLAAAARHRPAALTRCLLPAPLPVPPHPHQESPVLRRVPTAGPSGVVGASTGAQPSAVGAGGVRRLRCWIHLRAPSSIETATPHEMYAAASSELLFCQHRLAASHPFAMTAREPRALSWRPSSSGAALVPIPFNHLAFGRGRSSRAVT